MNTETLATVTIGPTALAILTDKIESLNKRADRHGMNKLVMTVVSTTVEHNKDRGCDEDRNVVEISGCAPCINGYVLSAKIERDEVIGTLVSVVPGKYDKRDYSKYRNHDFGCDHCNSRRGRKAVYVLTHDSGHETVVGRNCLADFIRSDNADDFARYAEFVDSVKNFSEAGLVDAWEEEFRSGRADYPDMSLETFLPLVQAVTRRVGWVSRTAAKEVDGLMATADWTIQILCTYNRFIREFVAKNEIDVCDNDRDAAAQAIEWAKSLPSEQTDKSEYLHVIQSIATAGHTNRRLAGYAASIIRAYQNDCDRRAEREEKAKNAPRKVYAGEPCKTRDIGNVRIVRVNFIDGFYGTKTIVSMELDMADGSIAPITWFGSGSHDYAAGEEFHLRAGIKECKDDEKWGKQTIVTRAKFTDCKPNAPTPAPVDANEKSDREPVKQW